MIYKIMAWITQVVFVLGISLSLTVTFVPEAFAQDRASKPKRATVKPLRAKIVNKEVSVFCKGRKIETSTDGTTTTYSCGQEGGGIFSSGGGASGTTAGSKIKVNPGVAKSKINCDYSMDGEGNTTWNGCSCTADGDSNCTDFITNCAKEGDEVGGNSGAATCSP